jgi:hypothetical protein
LLGGEEVAHAGGDGAGHAHDEDRHDGERDGDLGDGEAFVAAPATQNRPRTLNVPSCDAHDRRPHARDDNPRLAATFFHVSSATLHRV